MVGIIRDTHGLMFAGNGIPCVVDGHMMIRPVITGCYTHLTVIIIAFFSYTVKVKRGYLKAERRR